ncbi:MAG: ATP-binding protein, partial [Caldimonas sp.]
ARWLTGEKGEPPTFVCTGPTIAEAVLTASALFAFAGRPTLTFDLAALRASANAADAIAACELIQRVLGIGLIATPLDAIQDAEPRPTDAGLVALRELLARSPALALVAGPSPRWREATAERRILEVRSDPLPASERARVWRQMIGEPVDERVVEALADRFVLGADRIARAAAIAHDAKTIGERRALAVGDLYDAARWVSNDAFTATTQTADLPYDWDDLIVPAEVRTRLSDLLQAVELRPQVLGQWGFGGRLGGARGIKVLFAGASGTGKTMAAAVIAKSLGVDLHRVDLAATVSKYIGETEKNLDRAFAAARRANAILFIDEAEALLGKRSEVRDAHDRYANVETAYLLQRMEEHDGVVVLATNLAQNIDEAFSRRMHYVIDFPMPDAGSREALWRRMIPPEAPLADDVDFAFLARRFALAGGDIRNLVLDAAYRAAQAGDAIGMRHMLRAVMQQFAKRGRVPAVGEFGPYAAMLAVAGDGNAPPRPHHSASAEALAAAAES